MAKSFQKLRWNMSPAGKAANAAEYTRLTKELSLQELRKARELTQTTIAAELEIAQGDVSKLERPSARAERWAFWSLVRRRLIRLWWLLSSQSNTG